MTKQLPPRQKSCRKGGKQKRARQFSSKILKIHCLTPSCDKFYFKFDNVQLPIYHCNHSSNSLMFELPRNLQTVNGQTITELMPDTRIRKASITMITGILNISFPVRMTPCPNRLQLQTLLMGVILTRKMTFWCLTKVFVHTIKTCILNILTPVNTKHTKQTKHAFYIKCTQHKAQEQQNLSSLFH